MNKNFKTIDQNDLIDFINECEARQIYTEGFQLVEHDVIETELNESTSIINGKLTVSRGNYLKTYVTGDSTDWLVDFARDLRSKVFG
jgi:hypothetical protein